MNNLNLHLVNMGGGIKVQCQVVLVKPKTNDKWIDEGDQKQSSFVMQQEDYKYLLQA